MAQKPQQSDRLVPRYAEEELRGGPPLEGNAHGEDPGDVDDAAAHQGAEPEPEPYTIAIRVKIQPDIDGLIERVHRFNHEILGSPQPQRPSVLSGERARFRLGHLNEELEEFDTATGGGDLQGAADAMVDLIYVAMGTLYDMGVNVGPTFDEVHAANMRKVRGEVSKRPGSQGHDAVKPEGWTPPDHDWILGATPERVALGMIAEERGIDADLLRSISDVFLHVARIRAGKGRDYNTSVKLVDYFPHGHKSYHQVQHMKTLRAKSLVELIGRGMVPNYEGLLDTLYDNLNYTCFWAEAIRDGRLPITGERGAVDNGHVETA